MYLQQAPTGSTVIIDSFSISNEVTRRLNEMGIFQGTIVKIIRKSPFNGPIIIEHNSHKIALRFSKEFQISVLLAT